MRVDPFKLNHWINARKLTPEMVAELARVPLADVSGLLRGDEADGQAAAAVAAALQVAPAQLADSGPPELTTVWRESADLWASCRPIQRDGIHFYNYYTMAAPPGRVAPVILDILCPAGRLPMLNNGHLEPAITVNLGPGDIHGRWGTELSSATWQPITANHDADSWLVGESYVEPSYCPHAYSLASEEPARIVSYTGHANLGALIEELNTWTGPAFEQVTKMLESGLPPEAVADILLAARGHDRASAAAAAGVSEAEFVGALAGQPGDIGVLAAVGAAVGLDYRLLLPAVRRRDAVGKTYLDLPGTRASVRPFLGYQVASMASAPHLPDLIGLFVKVTGERGSTLTEPNETHYLIVEGELTLEWTDADGQGRSRSGGPDASAWVGPFVSHRWTGDGAVLKLSSGPHIGLLDLVELTNTYAPGATIRRGHRDLRSWGYDS